MKPAVPSFAQLSRALPLGNGAAAIQRCTLLLPQWGDHAVVDALRAEGWVK